MRYNVKPPILSIAEKRNQSSTPIYRPSIPDIETKGTSRSNHLRNTLLIPAVASPALSLIQVPLPSRKLKLGSLLRQPYRLLEVVLLPVELRSLNLSLPSMME